MALAWRDLTETLQLSGHTGEVGSCAFSPDGKRLASGGGGGGVRSWDLEAKAPLEQASFGEAIAAVRFMPAGDQLLVLDRKGTLRLLAFPSLERLWEQALELGNKATAAVAPDGSCVAVGGRGGQLALLDPATGAEQRAWPAHEKGLRALAFAPDGARLVSGGSDDAVRIWSLVDGAMQAEMTQHYGQVLAVDVHPGGNLIASGSLDKAAFIWDPTEDKLFREYHLHAGFVTACRFHPSEPVLATGSNDSTLKFWDMNAPGQRMLGNLKRHDWTVHEINFDPAGERMVSASTDETVRVWDLREDA